MSLAGTVVLSAYLAVPNPVYFDNAEQEAYKNLAKATYLQFKMDKIVKKVEKKYTPDWVYEYGVYVAPLIRIVSEKKLTYTWRF